MYFRAMHYLAPCHMVFILWPIIYYLVAMRQFSRSHTFYILGCVLFLLWTHYLSLVLIYALFICWPHIIYLLDT